MRILSSAVGCIAAALLITLAGDVLPAATFVVSPNGKDTQPGTAAQPLATLEAARDAARKTPGGPHKISVLPGDYFLSKPLELDARDNGLTIEAAPGGTVTLYGGRLVTGWRRDGKFWTADLPGVKEGRWDFRALVVNGRMPPRARYPESETFLHKGTWNLPLLPAVAGFWERKPTREELTTMPYDPKDIPATLDVRNAEVRLYHMWDESLVGVERNELERHALIFAQPAVSPPGAFHIYKYVIFNTREGMTQPGQWYLDRTAGRLVYWPLADEDLARAKVIAPSMESIVRIAGNAKKKAERITLRGLRLTATTPPLKPASFGAGGFDGALSMTAARQCVVERLEIANVGALGIVAHQIADCRLADNHVHHTGACGVRINGTNTEIVGNHIHHLGVYYPSAAASMLNGERLHVARNEIHDGPYSGIIGGGKDHVFEQNLIYRVMRELHDGAAIYGNLKHCVVRGNVVRDVVEFGKGFGASAYYLDEGSCDCVIENNVAIGVPMPTHNHITHNTVVRNNVFIADGDMTISFQRSSGCTFEGNTLFVPGRVQLRQPNGIRRWAGNVLFRNGQGQQGQAQAFTIDDAMPPVATPGPRGEAAVAARVPQAPTLDGEITVDEWPGKMQALSRDASRQSAVGPPVFVKLAYDDRCLYVGVTVAMFELAKIRRGSAWGQDDGAEICLAGRTPDGKPAVFVLRGYAGGASQSVADAGAPAEAVVRLGRETRFTAKVILGRGKNEKGWRGEWAIPFAALGLQPAAGLKVPFNMGVYSSQYDQRNCWEGTQAENWRLDQAGTLQLQ
jgi:hypothetical protein